MGKFLNKMERKFGKYAIHNLTLYLIIGYVVGIAVEYLVPEMMSYLTLDPEKILHGQIWRLVTWIINPYSSNLFFFIIMLFFYYSIGNTLEHTIGAFRYNVFMFSGFFFSILGAFILYAVMKIMGIDAISASGMVYSVGNYISTYFSAYYINLSIFLAFAILYPDMQVMLYFVIPLKIKWVAYVDIALIAVEFLFGSWIDWVAIAASLLNVLIFYLSTRNVYRVTAGQRKARREFRKQMEQASQRRPGGYPGQQSSTAGSGARPMHRCAVCGRTELDNPSLTFRYCSKCAGNYEYCEDHLFTHEHKR